jgi:hypothetical protein
MTAAEGFRSRLETLVNRGINDEFSARFWFFALYWPMQLDTFGAIKGKRLKYLPPPAIVVTPKALGGIGFLPFAHLSNSGALIANVFYHTEVRDAINMCAAIMTHGKSETQVERSISTLLKMVEGKEDVWEDKVLNNTVMTMRKSRKAILDLIPRSVTANAENARDLLREKYKLDMRGLEVWNTFNRQAKKAMMSAKLGRAHRIQRARDSMGALDNAMNLTEYPDALLNAFPWACTAVFEETDQQKVNLKKFESTPFDVMDESISGAARYFGLSSKSSDTPSNVVRELGALIRRRDAGSFMDSELSIEQMLAILIRHSAAASTKVEKMEAIILTLQVMGASLSKATSIANFVTAPKNEIALTTRIMFSGASWSNPSITVLSWVPTSLESNLTGYSEFKFMSGVDNSAYMIRVLCQMRMLYDFAVSKAIPVKRYARFVPAGRFTESTFALYEKSSKNIKRMMVMGMILEATVRGDDVDRLVSKYVVPLVGGQE